MSPGLARSISPGSPALTRKSALRPFLLRARADGSNRSRLLGSASAVHRVAIGPVSTALRVGEIEFGSRAKRGSTFVRAQGQAATLKLSGAFWNNSCLE